MYEFDIVECKPENAVGIIDTDVRIEFAEPLDYKDFVSFSCHFVL